jgi:uncharacterized protein YukE
MAQNTLGRLAVQIGADTTEFQSKMAGLQKNFKQLSTQFSQIGRTLTRNVTLPMAALGGSILMLASRTASYADEIDKMSIRTGISRGQLQEMRYVTDQLGVSFESVQGVIESFTRRLPQIEQGTSESARQFHRLGVQLKDASGEMRSMDDLFRETLFSLSQMTNETERNAIATQIFGRRAFEIVPLLSAGSDRIEEMTARAHELGLVMDDEGIKSAVAYKDAMSELKQTFGAVSRDIAMQFIPILKDEIIPLIQKEVIPRLVKFAEFVADLSRKFSGLTDSQKKYTLALIGFTIAAGPALSALGQLVKLFGALRGMALLAAKPFMVLPVAIGAIAIGMSRWSNAQAKTKAEVDDAREGVSDFNSIMEQYGWDVETATRNTEKFGAALKDVGPGNAVKVYGLFTAELEKANERYAELLNSMEPLTGARLSEAQALRAQIDLLEQELALRERLTQSVQSMTGASVELKTSISGIPLILQGIKTGAEALNETFSRSSVIWADMILNLKDALERGSDWFIQYAALGKRSLEDLARTFRNIATQIIAAEIAKGIAAQVRSALQSVPFPFGIAAGAAAGGAAAALFQRIIPSFATGGIADRPMLAMVGDNPNARFDPEIISPVSKIRNEIKGVIESAPTQRERLVATISGDDLRVLLERNQKKRYNTIG